MKTKHVYDVLFYSYNLYIFIFIILTEKYFPSYHLNFSSFQKNQIMFALLFRLSCISQSLTHIQIHIMTIFPWYCIILSRASSPLHSQTITHVLLKPLYNNIWFLSFFKISILTHWNCPSYLTLSILLIK